MLDIELKRDAYKYGGTPYLASEQGKAQLKSEPVAAEETEENAIDKYVNSAQKAYQARSAFIAYALKNGYDSEYLTYFAMWFVASFGLIVIMRWALQKLALRDIERKHKEMFDKVVEEQLVGVL